MPLRRATLVSARSPTSSELRLADPNDDRRIEAILSLRPVDANQQDAAAPLHVAWFRPAHRSAMTRALSGVRTFWT